MAEYTIFEQNGKIGCVITGPEGCHENYPFPVGGGFVEGRFDSATHYVDTVTQESAPRPENPSTIDKNTVDDDGIDFVTISSIPTGTILRISSVPGTWQIDDGSVELTFDSSGAYTIYLESFPEKDKEFTVNAS